MGPNVSLPQQKTWIMWNSCKTRLKQPFSAGGAGVHLYLSCCRGLGLAANSIPAEGALKLLKNHELFCLWNGKIRQGRGGRTLKMLYAFRSLLPLSWQSGLFLKQHKRKSSKRNASSSHRPQNNLRDHFLYSYCCALCYHGGFLSSIFELVTNCWLIMCFSITAGIRAGTFPQSQSKTAVPDVGCSLIFTKGRTSHIFFLPTFHYIIWFCHSEATCFTHYPPVHHFLHCSNLHRLPPSTIVEAEKVSLEYSKAQIQGEK